MITAFIILGVYTLMMTYTVLFTVQKVTSAIKRGSGREDGCVKHVVILFLLIGFNLTLILTDTGGGLNLYLKTMGEHNYTSTQYIFMSFLLYEIVAYMRDLNETN